MLVGLLVTAFMNVATPEIEWAFDSQGKIYASPIIADLDGDGLCEVIVAASRAGRVICLDGQGELRWDFRVEDGNADGIQATPSAVDYDGDGAREVFFLTKGGVVGCLDHQGELIWRTHLGDAVDYSGPVVADIDSDGRVEVVFGSDSGTVYCLDDSGAGRWHYQGDGEVRGIPAVAWHEPSRSMRIYVTFGAGTEACLSSEGQILWAFNEPMPRRERRSGPAVGDIDGDGGLDVVFATEDFRIIVRDAATGAEKWRWKGAHHIDQTSTFALVDFDGTGTLDIVCGDGSGQGGPGNVYRLRNGAPLWTADVAGSVVQGPSVGDVDGDGQLDILVCSRSKRLLCLSASGEEQWSVPSATEVLTTPALGDIDNDGEVEIVFTSKDHLVRCVTVHGKADAARLPWPMISHDAQLSGNARGAAFACDKPHAPDAPIEALTLDAFGPLTMGDNTVSFTFVNTDYRPRLLEAVAEITRPDGSRITERVTERREPFEVKHVTFDVPVLFEGTYVLALRLVDVGSGKTLAAVDTGCEIDAFAAERESLAAAFEAARMRAGGLAHEPLRTRALDALDATGTKAVAAIDQAVLRSDPAPGERRRDIDAVQNALRAFRHTVARIDAARATPAEVTEFAVVAETTLRKVFRDESFPAEPRDAIIPAIAVAGNEYEGVQLVVVPLWTGLEGMRLSVSDLHQADGAGVIPSAQIIVNRIGYVEIGPPEYNWHVDKVGFYPDILFDDAPTDVPAEQCAQPFFLTVKAAADTAPGDYEGTIRIEANGGAALDLPLRVHVWAFHIPEKPHFKVSLWMNEGQIAAFYRYEGRTPFEVRQRYYDYHLEHRASPIRAFPPAGGDMLDDFDYLVAHGQNSLFVDIPEYLEEGDRPACAEQLLATRDLLREKGWADLAMIYTRDEVAVVARHLIPKVVEMNHWIKTVLPEWPRLQTSAPEQALFDAVDIWCPCINAFDPVILEERKAKGDRLWFYTVWGRPGIMIEFPATDHRIMCWECWKFGAEGFLYWGTTHWDLNMQSDARWPDIPWIPYNRQPGHNGCGYLLYPGPDGTPLGSIRFEVLRDGIEDYEYLFRLKELMDAKGDAVPADLRAEAEAELAIPKEVVTNHEVFTEDPQVILDARERIARLIEIIGAREQEIESSSVGQMGSRP
ncbi:MAG TPA: FG-GAP-like repeat-containing protein [Candidatus Hydrogenedentes bacterium]|nr:FG-GAP-like repeat-containing protein [Candidatus Hydrogenedentota bacterium]HPG69789.1 FG-GAP-like repeat-containing protein [Candidatus Hydrogenedentota bacterium]